MCLSVTSDQSCSVNGKYNRELLKSHVMDNLVICSLQKRRINRHNRAHASRCKSCRKCHSMLFCNSYIKKAIREHTVETGQPGSIFHCSCNCCNVRILFCFCTHNFSKHIGIGILFLLL